MPTDDKPQESSNGSHFPEFPLYKRLMTSTRKLLQRRLCGCCCVNEFAVFKKSSTNEPAVVLTKAETITSQPGGGRPRTKPNGIANGALSNGSTNNAELGQRLEQNAIATRANDGRSSPNQFDEIDLNADNSAPTTVQNNKLYLDTNSSSSPTASGSAKTYLSAKQSEKSMKSEKVKEADEYGKKLASDVTDMMFNEICERAEGVGKDEVLQEETFEIDLNAVTEATDDEISNLGSQQRQPAHTDQDGNIHRYENTPPVNSTRTQSADNSARTDTEDERSHSENGKLPSDSITTKSPQKSGVEETETKQTPAKLDSPQKPPRTNLYNTLVNGVPEASPMNNGASFNFEDSAISREVREHDSMSNGKETSDQVKDAVSSFKKEHEKLCKKSSTMETKRIDEEEEDEHEHTVNGYAEGHPSDSYPSERLSNGNATIVAKDQNHGASLMYGVESSSEDSEEEGDVSSVVSSPTISTGGRSKQNNNVDKVKSKEDEQFEYKALETDTSERTA